MFYGNLYPGVPHIPLHYIKEGEPFVVSNLAGNQVEVLPFRVMHGKLPIMGFRIGGMAWITDMLNLPESSYDYLKGLDCLVMNALRIEPHWTHQSLSSALEQADRIAAGKTYFIHMSHHIGLHAEVQENLPENVFLAYDGLVIDMDEAGEKK